VICVNFIVTLTDKNIKHRGYRKRINNASSFFCFYKKLIPEK
jgi:hypothetical protein